MARVFFSIGGCGTAAATTYEEKNSNGKCDHAYDEEDDGEDGAELSRRGSCRGLGLGLLRHGVGKVISGRDGRYKR